MYVGVCTYPDATRFDFPPDDTIDVKLKDRIGKIPRTSEYIIHNQTIRNIKLDQIFAYTGPRFFIIDPRAVVDMETALVGFDINQHRLIRWARVHEGICARRLLPTHPCHRFPHLVDFIRPPPEIPLKIIQWEAFVDGAWFTNQHNILHECLRFLNMEKSKRQCLDNMYTLYFAPPGTKTVSHARLHCHWHCSHAAVAPAGTAVLLPVSLRASGGTGSPPPPPYQKVPFHKRNVHFFFTNDIFPKFDSFVSSYAN